MPGKSGKTLRNRQSLVSGHYWEKVSSIKGGISMPKPFGAGRAIVVTDKFVFTLTSTHLNRDSGGISRV